jgi:hypothetical protein
VTDEVTCSINCFQVSDQEPESVTRWGPGIGSPTPPQDRDLAVH